LIKAGHVGEAENEAGHNPDSGTDRRAADKRKQEDKIARKNMLNGQPVHRPADCPGQNGRKHNDEADDFLRF